MSESGAPLDSFEVLLRRRMVSASDRALRPFDPSAIALKAAGGSVAQPAIKPAKRTAWYVLLAAALILAALLFAAGSGAFRNLSVAPVVPSPSLPIPAGAQIDARINVGPPIEPRWIAADNQSLWVHEPTSLVRVDMATSAITGQVPMYVQYGYATTGPGAVWQTDFSHDALLRIDPVADQVVASIPVGLAPEGVAVTAGAVWVADENDGAVTRVDPATNTVVATIPIGSAASGGPQIMTAGPGGVWVDFPDMGAVVRIDPATNTVGTWVPLEGPVASDGTQVWIGVEAGLNGRPQVVRVDPVSGKVITAVDLDTSGITYLAVGLGSVWATTSDGLFRIDSATGRVIGRLNGVGVGGDVMVAGGAVWVTADDQPYVLRILPQ